MDFKGWLKLDEDDKTCTLEHPKGHVMKIALKALPAIHREQIKRLAFAKGGDVDGVSQQGRDVRHAHKLKTRSHREDEQKQALDFAKDEAKGRASFERESVKPKLKGLADGGEVRKSKGFWESEEGKQSLALQNKEVKNIRQRGKNVDQGVENESEENPHLNKIAPKHRKHYEEGGDVQSDNSSQDDSSSGQTQASPQPATIINIGAPQAQPAAQVPPPPQSPAMQYAKAPVDVDQPVIPQARPNLNPNGTMNPSAVAENSQQAVKAQQDINAAQAKAQAENERQNIEAQAQNQQRLDSALNDVKTHADAFAKYANDPASINPKHYQENMGTGSKVAATIGLALGGFGTAFGGHNFAYDHLENQINRDIDAQKQRMDTQKTVYGAYQQLYGDTAAAYNASKATMLDIYNAKAKQVALKLGTPQAQANYLKLSGEMALAQSKALQDAAVDLANLPGTRAGVSGQGSSGTPSMAPSGQSIQLRRTAVPAPAGDQKSEFNEGILAPHEAGAFVGAKYNPQLKDRYNELANQRTQATQADDALKNINGVFLDMAKNANASGISGRVHRNLNPHEIAGLAGGAGALAGTPLFGIGALPAGAAGAAIGEGIGHLVGQATDTSTNREYDALQERLTGFLSSALKGTNLGSEAIEKIVKKNRPEYGDDLKALETKIKTIREIIREHTPHDLLDLAGMTNKSRKKER